MLNSAAPIHVVQPAETEVLEWKYAEPSAMVMQIKLVCLFFFLAKAILKFWGQYIYGLVTS